MPLTELKKMHIYREAGEVEYIGLSGKISRDEIEERCGYKEFLVVDCALRDFVLTVYLA